MELRQYINVLLKWWWLIIASVLVAGGASYFSTRAMPKVYQSRTTLVVGQVLQNPNPDSNEFYTGQILGQSYADLVKREPVLNGTLNTLGLHWDWQTLQNMVSSKVINNTQLIEITVLDTDPQRAQALTAEIANQLILQSPAAIDPEKNSELQFTQSQIDDLKAKLKKAQDEVNQLDDVIAKASSARQIEEASTRQQALQSQIGGWQTTYANLLLTIQKGSPNSLSIVEPAQVPSTPVGPNTTNNTMLAAAIGLVLAGAAAFLLEYIDDTVKTPDDVTKSLGMQTLGSIARIGTREYPDKLVVVNQPLSPISEAYRVLRTNLQFSAIDKPLRTMMLTSARPVEGKSVTTANLGAIIAQSGKRVILVDADLRRPTQHRIFKLTNNAGLTTALLETTSDPSGILQDVGIENLKVMTSGPIPPNPSELLGSRRMGELINALLPHADIIIFDTPPVMAVADATILSSRLDGVVLVIDASKTRRALAQRAKAALVAVGAQLLGVTLNRVSARVESGYDYYYYSADGDRRKHHRSLGHRVRRLFSRNGHAQHTPKTMQTSSSRTTGR